ncbi:hypothetical protein GLAREA_08258 [Glarea lozoyensis ATCC 20868]|uniref:Uncharacterized protein n=1 Tax=Glarea lozoyensis (strain ATCC 20868 / MF5171) TaxID=1116229 RepID=S3CX61_GLAL2|nr:uncharacterized protein GLAREA_08258 [Glarea lozoyensis ATCC 20868]EPE24406.1 hypothetical protein GLAREA_08258 [Glarea lozoyensis ATCC 20868]
MSYAAAAAKGPKQSPEEARAPAPPEIETTESISTSSLIDVDTDSVHTVPSDFGTQSVQTDTQLERLQREAEAAEARAKEEAESAAKEVKDKTKTAKSKAKKEAGKFQENSDNPVFIGNAIAVVGLSAGLGFGAYRKYAAGELTWKVVGAWSGLVGLFAVGDFYLSQYLFKNKYPKK